MIPGLMAAQIGVLRFFADAVDGDLCQSFLSFPPGTFLLVTSL